MKSKNNIEETQIEDEDEFTAQIDKWLESQFRTCGHCGDTLETTDIRFCSSCHYSYLLIKNEYEQKGDQLLVCFCCGEIVEDLDEGLCGLCDTSN